MRISDWSSDVCSSDLIQSVAGDLFMSGHYNLSVAEAYKAVDKFVAERVPAVMQSGTTLMEQAFSPNAPYLKWSSMENASEVDEQKGYHRLFSGAMLGIRNPTRSEEHTSDIQSLMRISYAVFCLKKKKILSKITT